MYSSLERFMLSEEKGSKLICIFWEDGETLFMKRKQDVGRQCPYRPVSAGLKKIVPCAYQHHLVPILLELNVFLRAEGVCCSLDITLIAARIELYTDQVRHFETHQSQFVRLPSLSSVFLLSMLHVLHCGISVLSYSD